MSAQVSFFFFDVYYAASSSSLFKATGLCALGCVVMVIFFQIRIRAKITWSQHVHIYILPELRCLYLLPACAHLNVRIQVQASASLVSLKYILGNGIQSVCAYFIRLRRDLGDCIDKA